MDWPTRRSSRLQRRNDNQITDVEQPETMEIETINLIRDAVAVSPEGRLKTSSSFSQTTPGLLKNGFGSIPDLCPPKSQSVDEGDSDDEQCCPVCFEPWTNSGPHRLTSLACGHLFGRSCLERWLKELKNKCCPQCKSKAKLVDVRNIYAKTLKAYDTTERDQAKKELKEEKYKRSKAEEGEAKALLQYQILKQEMDSLKRQIESQQNTVSSSTTTVRDRQPLATKHSSTFMSTQTNRPNNPSNGKASRERLTKSFSFQKSLQVSQKECRVLSYDQQNMLMIVSKPSPNQLFPGYGVLKVSSLESRSSEYIRIHQKPIRDAKFNKSGDQLVLTASMDKTLKITSAISNSTVQSYTCPAPVWACAWNDSDKNYLYAGLQNGSCLIFDIRKTDTHLGLIRPRIGVPCPVVSLHYVPKPTENNDLNCEGLLVGTLQGGWFILKNNDAPAYVDQRLLFPEGSCTGLYFDPVTRHCLLSQRPGKKCPRTLFSICRLSGDGSEEIPLQVNVIQKCFGGNRAQSLTRSSLFTCPDDDRLLLCAGDEASSSVIVWDGHHGEEIQKLSSQGGAVFDVLNFSAYNSHFLAALTEQKLHFYQWK